jgi:hypothetical protein
MGPKLLFTLGIIVAHGAVAASLMHEKPPRPREIPLTCANSSGPLPYFAPAPELLAMTIIPAGVGDVMQP